MRNDAAKQSIFSKQLWTLWLWVTGVSSLYKCSLKHVKPFFINAIRRLLWSRRFTYPQLFQALSKNLREPQMMSSCSYFSSKQWCYFLSETMNHYFESQLGHCYVQWLIRDLSVIAFNHISSSVSACNARLSFWAVLRNLLILSKLFKQTEFIIRNPLQQLHRTAKLMDA